jgi:hypothetical protein
MSLGFNSKFQDTKGKRNQLYNSVSNIFELDESKEKVNLDTDHGTGERNFLTRQNTHAIIQDIENDAIRFNDTQEGNKMMFYCKDLWLLNLLL